MKATYYKTPIDFKALIEKRDLAKTTLETSIDQQLFLLATTAWREVWIYCFIASKIPYVGAVIKGITKTADTIGSIDDFWNSIVDLFGGGEEHKIQIDIDYYLDLYVDGRKCLCYLGAFLEH